jgi:hypothetical protein
MADYAAAHGGRAPFIDPAPRVRWAFATGRGAAAFAEEGRRRELFANWTAAHVFKADAASCSDSLLVYPQSTGRTSYRDQYFSCVSPDAVAPADSASLTRIFTM